MHLSAGTMGSWKKNLVISAFALGCGWIAGCSGGDEGPESPPHEGAMLPAQPGGPSSSSSSGPTGTAPGTNAQSGGGTVQDCIAACEAKHPQGAKLGKAIDTCWASSCTACLAMEDGALKPPTSGSCKTDVFTPSAACSTCTAQRCCSAWDACFGNADCVALNKCSVACYE